MEFDYAAASGKSIIAFYHSNPDDLIGSKLEKNDQGRQKLTAFTRKIKKSRMCKPWRTPEGLASAIKSAILYSIDILEFVSQAGPERPIYPPLPPLQI